MSKTDIFFPCFEGTRGEKPQIFHTQDLELSEDFLTTILKYVDDLCDIISNGDPNVERKVEVIQNLNNDVTCYRNELDVKKQIFEESNNDQDYYITNEAILSDLENDYLDEKKNIDFTGKSFSEALILASTKYDKILFIDLPVLYMKTTSLEHVVYTNWFFVLTLRTIYLHMF